MDMSGVIETVSGWAKTAGDWLAHFDLIGALAAFQKQPVLGSLFAIGSLIFILVVLAIQNKNTPDFVRQYRHYEVALILRKRLSVHRLIEYHREIAWRDFAAIGSASGLAGAALLAGGDLGDIAGADAHGHLTHDATVIVIASIGVQVASAVMMMICDFVHTNTISPLVPPLQRMKIVGEAIVLGGGAMIFNIAALISFMSVFSPWVSVFCSVVFAVTVIRLTGLRSIEVHELRKWVKIDLDSEWAPIDELVRLKSKKERDAIFAQEYKDGWPKDFEDPCGPVRD